MTFSDRFQRLAERIALRAGCWQHVVFWLVLILGWAAIGPAMRFSDSWQLLVNTPTTVFELFLELTILAGQSRQERGKEEILAEVRDTVTGVAERVVTIITGQQLIEDELREERTDLATLAAAIGHLSESERVALARLVTPDIDASKEA